MKSIYLATIIITMALAFVVAQSGATSDEEIVDPTTMIFQKTDDVTLESWNAAKRGLRYLASHQNIDGSWDGDVGFKLNEDYEVVEHSEAHIGVTALAGIAFLAGGHLPDRGKYANTITKCIDYILKNVSERGYITSNNTRMYSHAFASLFLAEVYGMTHRRDMREKLQETINLIVECQNKVGSWRYEPFAPESDMSITVCQLMALRAARNIGIKVPKSTIDRAVDYVRRSRVTYNAPMDRFRRYSPYYRIGKGSFLYQIDPQAGPSRSSFALTSAGVVSLFNAGHYNERDLSDSLEYITEMSEVVSSARWRGHYFYWYGNYYAAQAMYIAGGRHWRTYYPRIRKELIQDQRSKGNWNNSEGPGENFATAVATIVLQIPYNYLPIFQR